MPQFWGSVPVLVQTPLQLLRGSGQEHWPAAHTWPAAQMIPHPPQFRPSVAVATQAPPQLVRPAAQVPTHRPPEQTSLAPQA
jgi:hypothetical protein